MDSVLAQLSTSLASAHSLEALTRPLLQMLETVTGLESTYLTTIDHATGTQQVLFARNSRKLQIPEGATGPWAESLCRRAIEEQRFYTDDAPAHEINDRHGHEAGDDLLRGVAMALQKAMRAGDVLARVGGDEFVILGFGPQREADGQAAAALMQRRLTDATVGRYAAGGTCIDYAGASVGVACVDAQLTEPEQALREADAAMYRAKAARRAAA